MQGWGAKWALMFLCNCASLIWWPKEAFSLVDHHVSRHGWMQEHFMLNLWDMLAQVLMIGCKSIHAQVHLS